MGYASHLRDLFPDLELEVGDILLLEPHQVAALGDRLEPQMISDAIGNSPVIAEYLKRRHPPVSDYLEGLPPGSAERTSAAVHDFLWEIADWFIYVKDPQMYDSHAMHDWDFAAVTNRVDLTDATVIDAGAGTGKVAFEAAPRARLVFALEPTERLRSYIDEKATARGVSNIKTLPGTLDAVPLADNTVDVLLTCRAIGWSLDKELAEIGRVVRPGGVAMHLGMPDPPEENQTLHDGLLAGGYAPSSYTHAENPSLLYFRRFK